MQYLHVIISADSAREFVQVAGGGRAWFDQSYGKPGASKPFSGNSRAYLSRADFHAGSLFLLRGQTLHDACISLDV